LTQMDADANDSSQQRQRPTAFTTKHTKDTENCNVGGDGNGERQAADERRLTQMNQLRGNDPMTAFPRYLQLMYVATENMFSALTLLPFRLLVPRFEPL